MRKAFVIFFLLLASLCSNAQIRIAFGPSAMSTAEETEEQMNKLLKKSYILTFYYTGDSIADSILIHDVILINADYISYCMLYKDDTSKVAIAITKLGGQKGYEVKTFWKNRNVKRTSLYNSSLAPSGKWIEYYEDRWLKLIGKYINGKK